MTQLKLPQSGGSFIRQPDGSLKQQEKPAADPLHTPAKPAKPAPKSGATQEIT